MNTEYNLPLLAELNQNCTSYFLTLVLYLDLGKPKLSHWIEIYLTF